MTSQIEVTLHFLEKYEIKQNLNVNFRGEGVRKSKKAKGSFLIATWPNFLLPQSSFSYLFRIACYLELKFFDFSSNFGLF